MDDNYVLEDHDNISVKPSKRFPLAYDIRIGSSDGHTQMLTAVTESDLERLRSEINYIFRFTDNDD